MNSCAPSRLDRRFQVFLLLVCLSGVTLHVLRSFLFFSIYRDEATQVAAASSLLAGYGLTIPQAHDNGILALHHEPMVQFPLGYPVLLCGLLMLGNNIVIARLLASLITATVFYIGAYIILTRIKRLIGSVAALAVAAYWAFIWSPLRHLNMAEQLALSFFVAAVACGLLAVASRRWLPPALLSAAGMVGAVACRYAYWPLVLVVPLALALSQARLRPTKRIAISSVLMLAVPVVALCSIAAFNSAYGGRATLFRATPVPSGLHLANAVRCDPFPASALGFSQALDWLAPKVPQALTPAKRHALAWCVTAILVLAATASCPGLTSLRDVLRFPEGGLPADRVYGRFMVWCGTATIVLTLGMLAYLSLGRPVSFPQFAPEYGWLPIQERRYFAPAHPFLAVGLIASLFKVASQYRRGVWAASLIAMIVIGPVALNSGKDWVGCIIGYKGWGNAVGRTEAQLRYAMARRLVTDGWLCISVSDQSPPERGYEFMGGAFAVHIEHVRRLPHEKDRRLVFFCAAQLEQEVVHSLRCLQRGEPARFQRREIAPLGRYVAILLER